VQVDQALEGLLLAAGEAPVDRALLVGLQVVLEELVGEVAADGVARGLAALGGQVVGEEAEVLFQMTLVPSDGDELDNAVGGIVVEPVGVGDRDDAVFVGEEGVRG
jgi:hypothetical protein